VIAALLGAFPVAAQDAWVGLSVGGISARFDGPATVDFTRRVGWTLGVFADVESPVRPLDIRVEGRWSRRGGDETTGGGGAESDVLGVPLAIGPRFHLGRVALFPFVGFEVAYPLTARRSSDLEVGFADPARTEVGGFAGAALDVASPGGLRFGVEARWLRGFNPSFEGSAGRLDLRTAELALRISRALN
jgi:hypothetical protein